MLRSAILGIHERASAWIVYHLRCFLDYRRDLLAIALTIALLIACLRRSNWALLTLIVLLLVTISHWRAASATASLRLCLLHFRSKS
jgi:hypothetical protein